MKKFLSLDPISEKLDEISLECLAHVYEDVSFMDSELCFENPHSRTLKEGFGSWCAKVLPGLQDSVGKNLPSRKSWSETSVSNDLRGALEVSSLDHARRRFHDLCERSKLLTDCTDPLATTRPKPVKTPNAGSCLQVTTSSNFSTRYLTLY